MSATVVHAAGLVAVAGVFGGMAFFAFVYAPLVFIKLGTEAGGRFIREVFPVYHQGDVRLTARSAAHAHRPAQTISDRWKRACAENRSGPRSRLR